MKDLNVENLDNFLKQVVDDYFYMTEIKNCKIESTEDEKRYIVTIKAIYNLKKEKEENIEDNPNILCLEHYLRFYKLIKTYRKEIILDKPLNNKSKLKSELIDEFATSQKDYECIDTDYKVIRETSKEFLKFTNKLDNVWKILQNKYGKQ